VYELKDSSGKVAWSSTSVWKPVLKIKGVYNVADKYKIPTVSSGTYSLTSAIKDNYRSLPLFNDGQNPDGYLVLNNAIKI
jgi:hypothetical protein